MAMGKTAKNRMGSQLRDLRATDKWTGLLPLLISYAMRLCDIHDINNVKEKMGI